MPTFDQLLEEERIRREKEWRKDFLDVLLAFGFNDDEARAIVGLLPTDAEDWSERKKDAWAKIWADVQEQRQGPEIEREKLRQVIQGRYGTTDPEMLKMLSEQQAIIAGEGIRERQVQERAADVERRAQKMVRPYPTYGQMTAPFVGGAGEAVSPRFRQWMEREDILPGYYSERSQQEFREQQLAAGRRIARDYYEAWSDEPGEREEKRELKAFVKRKSPWEELLASPSFLQTLETRFRGLPARERGYFSSQFRPRTRFLG